MKILNKIIFLNILFLLSACGDNFNGFSDCDKIKGSGSITTRILELDTDISKIELNIPSEFVITSGTTQEIIIEGHPNVLDIIESKGEVVGTKWKLINGNYCIDSDETKIYAQLTNLERFEVNGVADIKSEGRLNIIAESLDLEVNGAAKMELDYTTNTNIDINLDGAGEIILSGETKTTNIKVDGASDIKLHNLISNSCIVDINGASKVDVNVLNDLKVDINGTGRVCYLGNPTVTSDINGVGRVVDCN